MRKGFVYSFFVSALVLGCTVSTTTNDTPDGSTPVTPTSDAGTDSPTTPTNNGLLGYTPTNVASALTGIDTSKLPDVDMSGAQSYNVSLIEPVFPGTIDTTVSQSDGSTLRVIIVKSMKLGPTATLTMDPKTPVAIVALTTVQIFGKIDAQAVETEPKSGGARYPDAPGKGAGAAGGGADSTHVGWGAGGASHCGAGGAGGLAAGTNGAAGATYGSALMSPLQGGSAGGSASFGAGAGGGAFQISAGTSIEIGSDAVLAAGGGGGVSGATTGYYVSQGAGSGGSILLEAATVTVAGTIQANGGGGGAGSGASQAGQRGSDATNNATPAPGAFPATTGAGGAGAAGADMAGKAGGAGDAVGGDALPGAGGGGAGWIRINTKSGAATITGVVSPAQTTTCATQGTLAP